MEKTLNSKYKQATKTRNVIPAVDIANHISTADFFHVPDN